MHSIYLIGVQSLNTTDWIATAALLVAILSFLVSLLSYFTSKNSLGITKKEHDERYSKIAVYFIEAYKWKKENECYVSFALSFTNKATLPNSIIKIELELEYIDKERNVGKVKIAPSNLIKPINLREYTNTIHCPLELSEKSAKTGWVTFKIPDLLNTEFNIELYKINATTSDELVTSIDTHIINSV